MENQIFQLEFFPHGNLLHLLRTSLQSSSFSTSPTVFHQATGSCCLTWQTWCLTGQCCYFLILSRKVDSNICNKYDEGITNTIQGQLHSWFKSIRQHTNQLGNTLLIPSNGGLFECHIKVTTFPPPQMCLFLNVSLQLEPPTGKRTACHLQWNEFQQCKIPKLRKIFNVD